MSSLTDARVRPSFTGEGYGRETPSPPVFFLVIDVLDAMFRAAEQDSVLVDLGANGLKHRVSLYADDILVFARPDLQELLAVKEILHCFGEA
jgi:hypothetical protein